MQNRPLNGATVLWWIPEVDDGRAGERGTINVLIVLQTQPSPAESSHRKSSMVVSRKHADFTIHVNTCIHMKVTACRRTFK